MKKKLRMIAGGVALITAFAGAAYMPSVSWIRGIGTGLLRQTLIFFREPVKDRDLMGELLGGQSYFQCVEENLSYEQMVQKRSQTFTGYRSVRSGFPESPFREEGFQSSFRCFQEPEQL